MWNQIRKSHTKNVHHKWSRIRVRPEKEAEFIHRQPKKRRRKNPDQKIPWPAKKANSNFMHNQLLSSLFNIFSITSPSLTSSPPTPNPRLFGNNCVWDKGQKAWNLKRKSHNGQKAWNIIRTSHKTIPPLVTNHIRCYNGHGSVHSISRILQHHVSTIFDITHHHHQPQTPDWTLQSL